MEQDTVSRCLPGHMESRLPNSEGIELDIYPTPTDLETSPDPPGEGSDQRVLPQNLWQRDLSLLVEPRALRDHLANERTFLAWLRTSLALSMIGIVTTQLFTLQSAHVPDMNLSFFVMGIPLGSVCQAAALFNMIIGAYRFWRHQNAMVKGQACAGGWEILLIGGFIAIVSASHSCKRSNFADRPLKQIILVFLILLLVSDSDRLAS